MAVAFLSYNSFHLLMTLVYKIYQYTCTELAEHGANDKKEVYRHITCFREVVYGSDNNMEDALLLHASDPATNTHLLLNCEHTDNHMQVL